MGFLSLDTCLEEGVEIETLVSPVEVKQKEGRLTGVKFIKNELGERDASGRRKPVPVPGTEFVEPIDTLIVAIGEQPEVESVSGTEIETTKWDTIKVDTETLATNKQGVFAGGDVVSGPDTVVEAIADGKKAALVIDRYLRGVELRELPRVILPQIFVEPVEVPEEELIEAVRVELPTVPVAERRKNFVEVNMSLSEEDAAREARRCLRCDLEFTQQEESEEQISSEEKLA